MKTFLRDNGLTIVLMALFLLSLAGQAVFGLGAENEQRIEHGAAVVTFAEYVRGGQFLSALFENWESEFLQMFAFVTLTAYLFQRGSPESKDPDKKAPQDSDPKTDESNPNAPWPVRAGGAIHALYAHSLSLALLALFVVSFALHAVNSVRHARDEALEHGQPPPSFGEHIVDAQFWFESFQNWQSEFLSTAVLVVLAIFLRERGSPESKPVAASHRKTGTD